jgi:hypothetical protein
MNDRPAIDLTRKAWVRELGEFAIYGTWVFSEDIEDTEPCIVITPRYRTIGFKPICIALSAAYLYNNPRYCVHKAREYAHLLGFDDDMSRTRKLAELIHDHLPDLINMPVDPQKAIVVGEAKVNVGGRMRTVELLDHEQTT